MPLLRSNQEAKLGRAIRAISGRIQSRQVAGRSTGVTILMLLFFVFPGKVARFAVDRPICLAGRLRLPARRLIWILRAH